MPVIVTRTDVKPAGSAFKHSDPAQEQQVLEYQEWIRQLPGVVSRTGTAVDEHTWVTTTIYQDDEAYEACQKLIDSNPITIERREYATANNFIVTRDVTRV